MQGLREFLAFFESQNGRYLKDNDFPGSGCQDPSDHIHFSLNEAQFPENMLRLALMAMGVEDNDEAFFAYRSYLSALLALQKFSLLPNFSAQYQVYPQ